MCWDCGTQNASLRHQRHKSQGRQEKKLRRHGTQATSRAIIKLYREDIKSRNASLETTALLHSKDCIPFKSKKPDNELPIVLSGEFHKDRGSYLRKSKRRQSEQKSVCLPNVREIHEITPLAFCCRFPSNVTTETTSCKSCSSSTHSTIGMLPFWPSLKIVLPRYIARQTGR